MESELGSSIGRVSTTDDYVTKEYRCQGVLSEWTPQLLVRQSERNRDALGEVGVPFLDGKLKEQGDYHVRFEQPLCQDTGISGQETRSLHADAWEEDVGIDDHPSNFGVIDGETVYIDIFDPLSVTTYSESRAEEFGITLVRYNEQQDAADYVWPFQTNHPY